MINIQIADLIAKAYHAISFLVPTLGGWFIYGGSGNCLTTMQQLPNLNSEWQPGPALYNNQTISYMCGAQVLEANTTFTTLIENMLAKLLIFYLSYSLLRLHPN